MRLFAWKLAEANLFLLERAYFEATFWTIGGPLDYLAHALTSLLASPWSAMPSVALTWIGLTELTRAASHIQAAPWRWLNLLPGALALTLTGHMGFGIWVTLFPDLFFQVALGFIAVFASYRLTEGRPFYLSLLLSPLLYLLCGAWCFLFAAAVAVRDALLDSDVTLRRRLCGLLPLIFASLFPYILIRLSLLTVSPLLAYTKHLLLFKGDNQLWNLLYVTLLVAAFAILFIQRIHLLPAKRWTSVLACTLTAILLGCAVERNPHLGTLLAMEYAAKAGDWGTILAEAREDNRPHRMMAIYRILALHKTERIAHDLFTYPVQTTHLSTTVDTVRLNGGLVLFEYGLVLNARKIVMEEVIDYGLSAERLRMLGMIACITSEGVAASTYFEKLARQPFYAQEARRWLRMMRGQEKPPRDFERVANAFATFRKTNPLLTMGPSLRLEEDIYTSYQNLKNCPNTMAIFYLCTTLLEKKPDKLTLNMDVLKQLEVNRELPMALQEGLLFHLVTTLKPQERDQFNYAAVGISNETLERWNRFLACQEKWAGNPARLREAMFASFGKTYWYYHVFTP